MKWFAILLVLCFSSRVIAQTPGYLNFTIEHGLPGNLVYCALQDREGYLWFGTDKGLARFDGEHFKTYGVEDGLPDPEVLDLCEDLHGRLWTVCFRQKPAYRLNGRFFTEKTDPLLAGISHNTFGFYFFEKQDSTLWITGGDQGFRLSPHGSLLARLYMSQAIILQIKKVGNDLIGYTGDALMLLDSLGNFSELLFETGKSAWAKSFATSSDRLLLAQNDGTTLLEYREGSIHTVATSPLVFQKLYTDRRGRFWGCLPGKGAVCFDNAEGGFSNPVWHLPGRKVTNVYEDRLGNFWFLTSGEGIFLLPQKQGVSWLPADELPSSNILSLAFTSNGDLLAGDDIGNVLRFSRGQFAEKIALGAKDGSNFVRQIVQEPSGTCWAVTDEGFFEWKKGGHPARWSEIMRQEVRSHIGSPKSLAIKDGKRWLGISLGIATFAKGSSLPVMASEGRVTVLAHDAEGILWKGGTEGLFSERDSFRYNWGERHPLLKSRIAAIRSGGQGRLWVVTPESGLLDVRVSVGDVRSVEAVNRRLSRPVKDIKNLFAAANGDLWLATNRGVFLIDQMGEVAQFTTRHGLASNEVNDVLRTGDTLWAATAGGLSMLVLQENDAPVNFKTALTGFNYQRPDTTFFLDLSGKSDSLAAIVLPQDARMPEAFFAGLNRRPTDVLHYRHERVERLLPFPYITFGNLLDGLRGRRDTLETDGASLLFGASLLPGRYRFRSTAFTFGGQGGEPVVWELTVLPHWAQTIWLWLAGILALSFWLWRFYRLRTKVYKMETSVSQLKLQALRAQINPHFVGNSINAIQKFFYPPDPEKASDYIHLFTVLLRKTLLLSEQDFIPFTEEVTYDREYLEMIKLRYGSQFEYEISGVEDIPSGLLFPAMFLQPILENATIHGLAPKGVSVLKLHFFMENNRFHCTVTDNGAGIKTSMERKRTNPGERRSKGTEILKNKTAMLNRLHHLYMRLEWHDRSDLPGDGGHGTKAVVSFLPKKQAAIQST